MKDYQATGERVMAVMLAMGRAMLDSMGQFPEGHPTEDEYAHAGKTMLKRCAARQMKHLFAKPVDVPVPADLLAALMADFIELSKLAERHDDLASRFHELETRLASARRIMRGREKRGYEQRASLALFELGLIGEGHGKGSRRRNYGSIKHEYNILREGGHPAVIGADFAAIAPCSHEDALAFLMERHGIKDWESIERGWRRNDIAKPRYDWEGYPVR